MRVAPEEGRYSLETNWSKYHYTYVPPRRPDDIDTQIAALRTRPFFSIVVPTYNTPRFLLERLLVSVRTQWYQEYELILVDDHSPLEATRTALRAAEGDRFKVVQLDRNLGISGATNTGIREARGDSHSLPRSR